MQLAFLAAPQALAEPVPASPALTIINPHKGYAYNLKGNLHDHSTNSDGAESPSVVGQWYADHGYAFYSITDHDHVTADPGVAGIVWLGTAEEDSNDGSSGHMNHLGVATPITTGSNQQRLDNARLQGGRTVLNHASRVSGGWNAGTITTLNGVLGMEVYNGHGYLSSSIWDSVLTSDKIIWGFANDDSHLAADRGSAYIMLNSSSASPSKTEILSQLAAGNFYASRGFDLSVSVSAGTVFAQTTNGNKIRWIKESGQIIKTTNAQSDTYTPSGDEKYIRIEVLDAADTPKAWSQPLTFPGNRTWYFAEGYTGPGFQEWLTIQNPNSSAASTTIEYTFRSGGSQTQNINIPANSRETIDVNTAVGSNKEVSAKITSDRPIVAERPMYFSFGGINGGHDVVGANSPSSTWYFAEGYTGSGFQQWLTLQNPNSTAATTTITYYFANGGTTTQETTVGANTRQTIDVNAAVGPNREVSAYVSSSQPIVVERPMYFSFGGTNGGHNVVGANSPSATWYFAEGYTGSGFQEWLTVQNPGSQSATATIEYQYRTGGGTSQTIAVPANSRYTVDVNSAIGPNKEASAKITSDRPIIAERPVYFDYNGKNGGHNVLGASAPSSTWSFAEGYTGAGFQEWLTIQNPSASQANLTIEYTFRGGGSQTQNVSIPANSRETVDVNAAAGSGKEVAVKITSDQPIIAERPIYFGLGGIDGGHNVVGYPD